MHKFAIIYIDLGAQQAEMYHSQTIILIESYQVANKLQSSIHFRKYENVYYSSVITLHYFCN